MRSFHGIEAQVDIVCWHHDGMTLTAELVSEWIDACPFTVPVTHCVDYIYSASTPGQSAHKQHKVEINTFICTIQSLVKLPLLI